MHTLTHTKRATSTSHSATYPIVHNKHIFSLQAVFYLFALRSTIYQTNLIPREHLFYSNRRPLAVYGCVTQEGGKGDGNAMVLVASEHCHRSAWNIYSEQNSEIAA